MQLLHPGNRKIPIIKPVLIAAGYILVYLAISLVSIHPAIGSGFLVKFPPAGLGFALLTLCSPAYFPLVLLMYFLSSLMMGAAPGIFTLLTAVIYTAIYTLAAVLIRRLANPARSDATLQRTSLLIFISIIAAFAVAVSVTPLLVLNDAIPRLVRSQVAFQLWSVETVGNVTVIPFLSELMRLLRRWSLASRRQPWRARLRRYRPEIVIAFLQTLILVITLWMVLVVWIADSSRLWYLLFLPLIWILLQFGFAGATAAVMVINIGGLFAVSAARYPLTETEDLRVFMLLASLTGLITGAAMSELRRAEFALRNRLAIEGQITSLATRFINLRTETIDDEIRNAMRDVAVFCGMDTSHLYLYAQGEQRIEEVYEWVTAGLAGRADSLKDGKPIILPWLYDQLAQKCFVHFSNLDELPAEAAVEKDYLRKRGIHCMVTVPIFAGEHLVGSLGFHSQVAERSWADEDMRLFSLLGEIFYSVLERRRTEAQSRENDRKFRSIVMQSYDGICILNENAEVVEWNRGMERIMGVPREQVLGKYIWDVQYQVAMLERRTPELYEHLKAMALKMLEADYLATHSNLLDVNVMRADGTVRITQTQVFLVQSARGKLLASITRDITDLRERQEELRINQSRLTEAGRLAHLGHFQIAIPSGKVILSDEVYRIANMTQVDSPLDLKEMMHLISPEDTPHVLELLETLMQSKKNVEYVLTMRLANGQTKYLHTISRPEHDEHGTLTHIFGTVMDITERKLSEEALRQSEARYRAVVEDQSDLIFRFLPDGTVTFVNEAFCRSYARQRGELVGKPFFRYSAMPANRELTGEFITWKTVRPITHEHQAILSDGKTHWLQWTDSPILNQDGEVVEYQSAGRDVTGSKRLEQELRYLSTHDALTGIYNRLFFEAELARIQRGRQYPVSILMADVNGLKATNDTRGHQAGDELLRRASRTLNTCFRPDDIVARFGGDEFAVLLPGVDVDGAREIEQRVHNAVHLHNQSADGYHLSLSIGIATSTRGQLMVDLVTQADAHMYRDKLRQKTGGVSAS